MKAAWAVLVAFLIFTPAVAQGQIVAPAPQVLLIEPGTRPAGIGGCYVAVADDAWVSFWNPGGLPLLDERVSAAVMYSSLVPDWGGLDYWAAATVLRTQNVGAFALTWTHLAYGEFPVDPYGDATFQAWESVRSLGYGISPVANLGVGINVKQVESEVAPPIGWTGRAQGATARGTAFDVGVLYRLETKHGPWQVRYGFGAAAQNLGGGMDFVDLTGDERSNMPRTLRLGASCRARGRPYMDALFCVEYKRSLVDEKDSWFYSEDPILGLGIELRTSLVGSGASSLGGVPSDVLAVRMGYVHDEDGEVKGFSFGLGVTVDSGFGPVSFDFANVPQAEGLSRPWRIGGSIGLGE